ncbi:hypothetical protein Hypma_000277 [Hypsizygus marmoreus]|uniref:Uncharacterized protein n=1 Tax=Hypsizygus marmoreus TaxID=39966 RepID=A0A369JAU5_HYPMA|nr:hypothetical protein Hypma_000277 [Hypsizygus marmoreus]
MASQIVDNGKPDSIVADRPNTEIVGGERLRTNIPIWRKVGWNSAPHSWMRWISSTHKNARFSRHSSVLVINTQSFAVRCSGSMHTSGHYPDAISFQRSRPDFRASVRTSDCVNTELIDLEDLGKDVIYPRGFDRQDQAASLEDPPSKW